MSWWRRRPEASRRAVALTALLGAATLTGSLAAAPAYASPTPRQKEWHINAMRLPDAWKISTGQGITVAVVDGGVSSDRPDLEGQVLAGHDFSPGAKSSTLAEQLGHGTEMASLIAGTGKGLNGQGAIGVAPGAKIMPLRVIDSDQAANDAQSEAAFNELMAKAIRYAADSTARIISISQGTYVRNADLESAVRYAKSKDKLIVAAVGNARSQNDPVEYPAAIPGVVGVTALDQKGDTPSFTETGPQVALAGPGKALVSACTGATGYCIADGTSGATAVVSGVAALVWAKHPDWTANQVLRVLIDTAQGPADGAKRNDYVGYGLVRPRIALESPGDPGPANVDPLVPASASASAAPSTGAAAKPSSGGQATVSSSGSGGGSGLPWVVVGVVAAVVVVGGVVVAVRRRTR
jgi:type VII secretion-associated serine protease mycosin